VVAERELPGFGQLCVGERGEGGAAVGGVGVEGGERGIAGGEGLVGPLVAGIGHVETGVVRMVLPKRAGWRRAW